MQALTARERVFLAVVARELDIRIIDTLCITSYDEFRQSALTILKSAAAADSGKDWLIIDDLVDTGRTAQEVRRLLPEAHFARSV
jgi:xanthine phosphoribosyltransferase